MREFPPQFRCEFFYGGNPDNDEMSDAENTNLAVITRYIVLTKYECKIIKDNKMIGFENLMKKTENERH